MKIEGQKATIQTSAQNVFKLCSNCCLFGSTLPPQVTDYTATENECHFNIQGMAKIDLTIVEKIEYTTIHYQATADKPINLDLFININDCGNYCESYINIDVDIPVFIAGMVKKPLQNFADQLIEKIKEKAEQA